MWRYFILTIFILKTNGECPPKAQFYPCTCVQSVSSVTDEYFFSSINVTTYGRSILCENIDTILNLQTIFKNLTKILFNEYQNFDSFSLRNTKLKEIPSNVFGNLTFLTIQFKDNPYLSTIHPESFTKINAKSVRVFETSNTNLSETIFQTVLSQFENLLKITMLNDNVQYIPSYAFRQSKLEQIWFGIEGGIDKQPLQSIDCYAFYHLNSLEFLRIFSDDLSRFDRNSLALERNPEMRHLELFIGGRQISSKSFPLTSLAQFGGRNVFLRFSGTSNLKYLDENIFKPFLEADQSKSSIDVAWSEGITWQIPTCPCEMYWIQRDYFHPTNFTLFDNRVFGYPCWNYDFSSCQNAK
jgi:hypothetical protein